MAAECRDSDGLPPVYPIIGAPDQAIFDRLKDSQWATENKELMAFLGLTGVKKEWVVELLGRIELSSFFLPFTGT